MKSVRLLHVFFLVVFLTFLASLGHSAYGYDKDICSDDNGDGVKECVSRTCCNGCGCNTECHTNADCPPEPTDTPRPSPTRTPTPRPSTTPIPTPTGALLRGYVYYDRGSNAKKNANDPFLGSVNFTLRNDTNTFTRNRTSNNTAVHPTPNLGFGTIPNDRYSIDAPTPPAGYRLIDCSSISIPNNPPTDRYFYCDNSGTMQLKKWTTGGSIGNRGMIQINGVEEAVDFPFVNPEPIGTFDVLNCNVAAGWTCDSSNYNQSLTVRIYEGATLIGSTTANVYRSDVEAAGVCNGTGNHGFNFTIPSSLKDGLSHSITIKIQDTPEGTEYLLPWGGNPKTLQCLPPSPTPTPASWYKLRDASFNKRGQLNNRLPPAITAFDSDDNESQRYLVSTSGTNIPGIVLGSPITNPNPSTEQALFSSRQWLNANYSYTPQLSTASYVEYVKARKEVRTITDITNSMTSGIYLLTGNNVTIDTTRETYLKNASPVILLVEGNVTINTTSHVFGSATNYIAVIAAGTGSTGTLTIDSSMTTLYGIFAANQIRFSNVATSTPLKIVGNVVSNQAVSAADLQLRNRGAGNSAPSLFVVFDPNQFLNLLPNLSVSTYEWKQLQ